MNKYRDALVKNQSLWPSGACSRTTWLGPSLCHGTGTVHCDVGMKACVVWSLRETRRQLDSHHTFSFRWVALPLIGVTGLRVFYVHWPFTSRSIIMDNIPVYPFHYKGFRYIVECQATSYILCWLQIPTKKIKGCGNTESDPGKISVQFVPVFFLWLIFNPLLRLSTKPCQHLNPSAGCLSGVWALCWVSALVWFLTSGEKGCFVHSEQYPASLLCSMSLNLLLI